MAIPFLPLLGAAARAMGTRAVMGMGGSRLASSFAASKAVDVLDLGRRLGTPKPSQQQIDAEKMRLAREEVVRFTAGTAKAAGALASIPVAAFSLTKALEGLGGGILARRQQYETLNAGIANAFAQIRRQELVLGVQTASGAAPSTRGLANAFMALKEDIRPLTEVGVRLANVFGTGIITAARGIVLLLTPITWSLEKLVDLIDQIPGVTVPTPESQAGLQGELRDFFRQVRSGNFGNPINQRPGANRRLP